MTNDDDRKLIREMAEGLAALGQASKDHSKFLERIDKRLDQQQASREQRDAQEAERYRQVREDISQMSGKISALEVTQASRELSHQKELQRIDRELLEVKKIADAGNTRSRQNREQAIRYGAMGAAVLAVIYALLPKDWAATLAQFFYPPEGD